MPYKDRERNLQCMRDWHARQTDEYRASENARLRTKIACTACGKPISTRGMSAHVRRMHSGGEGR